MSFRVLIAGGRSFTDYPRLRAALDTLLADRLPAVELLTGDGPGVPMLAASYAAANGLTVTARVPDFARFPVDAVERRDEWSAAVVADFREAVESPRPCLCRAAPLAPPASPAYRLTGRGGGARSRMAYSGE